MFNSLLIYLLSDSFAHKSFVFVLGESGMICGMSYQQLKAHIPGKQI